MEVFKYCRGCLITDVKMFHMNISSVAAYTKLLGIRLSDQQHYLCFECASLLHKYDDFYMKCHRANNFLICIDSEATKQTIRNINRKVHKLESKLGKSEIKTYNIFQLSDDLLDGNQRFNVDLEVKIENPELNLQETEINTCDNLSSDLEDTNVIKHVINAQEKSNYLDLSEIPKKTKKRKVKKDPPVKKKVKKAVESNCSIKEDPDNSIDNDFSDLDDEPLAKSIGKEKYYNDNTELPIKIKKKRTKFDVSHFEDFARIVFLTPEDAIKEVLLRKESSNYKNCQFKCDLCFRGFDAQNAFDNHMKKHSEDYGTYKCDLCHLRFRQQRFLCRHRHSTHIRKFYCKICPYICFSTYQAKTHISLHKGKKYPCKECGKQFSMPNSLLMHRRNKHMAECVCEICGSTFSTERGLETHKLIIHRQEKNEQQGPKCDDCGVHFSTETAWKRHLVLSTKHNVSNGCEYCGDTFPDIESLKRHTKLHTEGQTKPSDNVKLPAACTLCDRWLVSRIEYKYHMLADHPHSEAAMKINSTENNQWVCEMCGKTFKKQGFLQHHLRVHTGERHPHRCNECGASFSRPAALREHLAITHEKQPPKKRTEHCHLCNKTFAFRSALNKHVKAHLGIRPHKCAICDKSFPNPCDVKMHVKYVHCKEPWPKRDRSKRKIMKEAEVE